MTFKCYLGHPWCNEHVKPITEEDFKKAEAFFAGVDKAFDEGGPVEAMKTAKRLWDEQQ